MGKTTNELPSIKNHTSIEAIGVFFVFLKRPLSRGPAPNPGSHNPTSSSHSASKPTR